MEKVTADLAQELLFSEEAITLRFGSRAQALEVLQSAAPLLASWARSFRKSEARLKYTSDRHWFRISASKDNPSPQEIPMREPQILPGLAIAEMIIQPPMLSVFPY